MNVASLQKVAFALAESQTIDSVLLIIVQSLAPQSEVARARVWSRESGDVCGACDLEVGKVAGTGQRCCCNSKGTRSLQFIARPEWLLKQGIHSFTGPPLVFNGEILGVLGLFSRTHLTDEEFAWLRVFADNAPRRLLTAAPSRRPNVLSMKTPASNRGLAEHTATTWTVTTEGQLDFVNHFYLDVRGQSFEACAAPLEVWNKGGSDLPPFLSGLHPDHKERVREIFWDGIRSGRGWTFEAPFLHNSDGKYHWHIDRAVPLRDKQNKIVRFVGTCADIDKLKRTEGKNKTLPEISNLMVANLPEPALLTSICDALRRVVQFDWGRPGPTCLIRMHSACWPLPANKRWSLSSRDWN